MKKGQPFEIISKKYHSQYREVRKIWSNVDYELVLLKNILNKKKYICPKKFIKDDAELFTLIKDVHNFSVINEIQGVNNFVGYSVCQVEGSKKGHFKKCFVMLYQFGETSLDEFIKKNHQTFHKKESINFIQKLITRIMAVYSSLQTQKKVDLNYIFLDHEFILIEHYGEVNQQIKFCYFPLPFLKEHKLTQVNFHHYLYSARELRLINRQNTDRPQLPARLEVQEIILQSQRETDNSSCNNEILQKIGLCILKSFFLICQEVDVEDNQFQLYCMNQQFDVDFNWNLIDQYLNQCKQYREYAQIGQQLKLMLRQNQDQRCFQQYSQMLKCSKVRMSKDNTQSNQVTPQKEEGNQNNSYIKIRENQSDLRISSPKKHQKEQYQDDPYSKLREIKSMITSRPTQVVEYQDGSKYEGELHENLRQGLGVYTFAEGDIFAGAWKDDYMTGQGYYYFTNGERYEGQVQGGVKEGYGSYYYANGDCYVGMWRNDLKQGYGEFYCSENKELYKGHFHNNYKEGKGTIEYQDRHKFEGSFNHGLKNGSGCLTDPSGRLFLKAVWRNDNIIGSAEIFLSNNDYYIGQVHNNKKEGKGIYKYNDGTVYQGQFQDDKLFGMCTIRYPNGDIYEGEVADGVFEGRGKYYYRDSELIYEGCWHRGVEEGKGTYIYKDEVVMDTQIRDRNNINYSFKRKLDDAI